MGIEDPAPARARRARRCSAGGKHASRVLDDVAYFRGRERRPHRLHQAHDAAHVRGREARAETRRIDVVVRSEGEARIERRHDGGGCVARRASRRAEKDRAAGIRIRGDSAIAQYRADVDDVRAVAGAVARSRARLVAGGDDDRNVERHHFVDRRLQDRIAGSEGRDREAQVDEVGRIRVVGDVRDAEARGPANGIRDIGAVAAAFAEGAQRQDLRVPVDARDAEGVIGFGGDDSRDDGAVPARVGDRAPEKQGVRIDVGLGYPIAWIRRIDVAAIAVVAVRLVGIGDEVIPRKDPPRAEVGVVEDARVDHRDDLLRRPGGDVPRGEGADAVGVTE